MATIGPSDDTPTCKNAEALQVIRNFAGLAMGANYAYESDIVAEQEIEYYYVSAFEQMQQITKCSSDEQRKVCFEKLSSAACDAQIINDSGIEIAFSNCGIVMPSYHSTHAAITGPDRADEIPWPLYSLVPALILAAIVYFGAGLIESPFRTEGGATFFNSVF